MHELDLTSWWDCHHGWVEICDLSQLRNPNHQFPLQQVSLKTCDQMASYASLIRWDPNLYIPSHVSDWTVGTQTTIPISMGVLINKRIMWYIGKLFWISRTLFCCLVQQIFLVEKEKMSWFFLMQNLWISYRRNGNATLLSHAVSCIAQNPLVAQISRKSPTWNLTWAAHSL